MRRRYRDKVRRGNGPPLVFGIFWTAFSSIFVVVGLWATFGESKVKGWDEVPCQIETFEITASKKLDPPFRPDVEFSYNHGGRNRVGTALWREKEGVEDYDELAELREELWSNLEVSCRVNPEDSEEAVLIMDQESIWFGLAFAAFGGGFVLVGVGLIVSSLKKKKAKTAVSSKKDGEMGGLLGCGFFGVFAFAGLGIMFGMVVPKAFTYFKMKSWEEAPAEVIWSRVKSHSSDDGTTYSVDVFYKYQVGDRVFRSNRWNLVGGSSSGRSGKQAAVKAHPRGKKFVCYVDPDEPWRAVVDRKLGWAALFALFPLPFIAVGVGGLWYTFVRKPKKALTAKSGDGSPKVGTVPEGKSPSPSGVGRRKRIWNFVGSVLIAAFWNGIVSVFLVIAWKEWKGGDPQWFLIIFLIPFVLIGTFLLLNVPYRLLAIFSPVYQLTWGDEQIAPGDRVRLSWRRSGGGGRPRRLTVWLIGQEEATYRRGSNTSTATSIFHEDKLFETETPQMMPAGTCDLAIPDDGVPTFTGEHNKIRWIVRLVADVPWRPDVSDEHDLEIGSTKGGEG
ncbi:DUF3592 domain-containing protein [Haloferula sp.]|uniref:DUF3592 domain-containing protein n=1 Tax=Haloferula sp. TaxID=2497595 RepID=UPI00329C0754